MVIPAYCITLLLLCELNSLDLAAGTHMDDEYAWAGVEDPKIVVTTSHSPSSRLKQFAKVRILCDLLYMYIQMYTV